MTGVTRLELALVTLARQGKLTPDECMAVHACVQTVTDIFSKGGAEALRFINEYGNRSREALTSLNQSIKEGG